MKKAGTDKMTVSENHQLTDEFAIDTSKNELGDIMSQDLHSKKFEDMTKEEKDQYIKNFYFPFIKKLDDTGMAFEGSRQLGIAFEGGRKLGEQIVNEILKNNAQKERQEILSEANYATIVINKDNFDEATLEDQTTFLCQYLAFFISIQNYLNYKEGDDLKYARLASPPKEAYEYR